MPWQLLLDGPLADEAARAVRDVARAIAEVAPDRASASERTLFWAYATAVIDEPYAQAAYDAALDDLVAELRRGAAHPALYNNGLAGMGWVLGHVLDEDADEALTVIDEALLRALAIEPWPGHHDLTTGLVGYGVYFLGRLDRPDARPAPVAADGLARVIALLERAALRGDDGATWHSPLALLPEHYHAVWPEGHYDCGLAHGVPGAIALLGHAAALPGAPVAARALCDDAQRWLAAQQLPPDAGGRFPSMVYPGQPAHGSRAAWCYGDPGVAAALWIASERLGTPDQLARDTARDCATREVARCGVRDAGLCHGGAGLAHLCNRFFHASGDPVFRDAARGWFERTLAMRVPGGVGGFVSWRGEPDGDQPIAGLIDGAIGVALALISAIAPVEPRWDRYMLCDVPVAAA